MSKAMHSWSGMRKYLEQDMIADCFAKRIRYDCTFYVNMDGSKIFRLFIDNQEVKRFSHETVNSYFIAQGFRKQDAEIFGTADYWKDYWSLLSEIPLNQRTEYTDSEFCDALEQYRNQDIQESLCSENPIVLMFALLDRRTGKRTLEKLQEGILQQPSWIQNIFRLRTVQNLHPNY